MMKRYLLLLLVFLSGCISPSLRQYTSLKGANLTKLDFNPYTWVCSISNAKYPYFTFLVNGNVGLVSNGFLEFKRPFVIQGGNISLPRTILSLPAKARYPLYLKALGIESVVIDPGHGGKDPGAIGKGGLREKDVVLDIALRLARILRKKGVKVTLTRKDDRFLSLRQRSLIANNSGAQLFLSIHSNANRKRYRRGLEVYYYSKYPSGKEARITQVLEDSVLRYENTPIRGSTVKNILWDLVRQENRAEALRLAKYFCDVFSKRNLFYVRGIRSASFYVLRSTLIPALLLEIGYISNPYEEKLLKSPYFREEAAEAVSCAVFSFDRDFGKIVVKR